MFYKNLFFNQFYTIATVFNFNTLLMLLFFFTNSEVYMTLCLYYAFQYIYYSMFRYNNNLYDPMQDFFIDVYYIYFHDKRVEKFWCFFSLFIYLVVPYFYIHSKVIDLVQNSKHKIFVRKIFIKNNLFIFFLFFILTFIFIRFY